MGITSNDIAAQRAMLARGEEKRKADWKQAERERLRDTFAAAALTGLIANGDYSVESTPTLAWRMADAMLRERDKTSAEKHSGSVSVALTDEEREAVERGYCSLMGVEDMSAECTRWDAEAAATLRKLLERLEGAR